MDGLFPLSDIADGHLSRATISPCREYRYTLDRVWDTKLPKVLFVMLNPSTADATANDPTIRRCIDRAQNEGFGGLCVVNLFGLRATKPGVLATHPDPVGPGNDAWITAALADAPALVIAAWGSSPYAAGARLAARAAERAARVLELVAAHDLPVKCLGTTKEGHPRHPLYVAGALPLIDFDPWRAAV